MKFRWPLLTVSLAAIAASHVIALIGLVAVTPITSMLLFFVGAPVLLVGVVAYLVDVVRDLRRQGVV